MTLQPRLNTSDDSYIFLIERSISLHTWRPTSTTGEEEEEAEEAEFRLKFLRLVSIGSLTAGTERSWRASCFGVLITTQDLFFLWERLLNLRVIDQKKKKKPGTSWTASTDWSDRIHPPGSGKKRAASPRFGLWLLWRPQNWFFPTTRFVSFQVSSEFFFRLVHASRPRYVNGVARGSDQPT